jgi:myo-inositol 2-dehydrogenase/D-chiro-inositol 1-dehydrogenase
MNAVRVGIVGTGSVASSVHLPILTRRSDLFEIVALADLNINAAHTLASRFGIAISNCFEDPSAMLRIKEMDAILILNSGSHAEIVEIALRAGKTVFCEKPLAYSRAEMNAIARASQESGSKLMIGYMKTFDPAVIEAQKVIKSRPRTVDVLVLHPSGDSQLVTSDESLNIPKPSKELINIFAKSRIAVQEQALGKAGAESFGNLYSEIVLGSVIHEFSVLRALDIHITDIDYVDRWPDGSASDSLIICGRTSDGVRVTVRWFYLDQYPFYQEEIRWVSGEEGHHIIFPSPYILRVPTQLVSTLRKGIDHQINKFESYKPSFENELEAFYKLVKKGEQKSDPIADGLEDLVLAQKIAKKIAENEMTPLGGELLN